MELKMFLKGEFIDALPINELKMNSSDYITYLKYELVLRNEELLSYSTEEPEYAIDTIASSMNSFRNKLDEVINSFPENKKNKE